MSKWLMVKNVVENPLQKGVQRFSFARFW